MLDGRVRAPLLPLGRCPIGMEGDSVFEGRVRAPTLLLPICEDGGSVPFLVSGAKVWALMRGWALSDGDPPCVGPGKGVWRRACGLVFRLSVGDDGCTLWVWVL